MLDDGKDLSKRVKVLKQEKRLRDIVSVSGRKRPAGEMNGKSANLNNACRQIYPEVWCAVLLFRGNQRCSVTVAAGVVLACLLRLLCSTFFEAAPVGAADVQGWCRIRTGSSQPDCRASDGHAGERNEPVTRLGVRRRCRLVTLPAPTGAQVLANPAYKDTLYHLCRLGSEQTRY